MMTKLSKLLLTATLISPAIQVSAQTITGLTTDGKLFTIANAAVPGTATTPVAITGIPASMGIAGIDYRPNTGQLYALAYDPLTNAAQLYTIAASGAATAIGSSTITLMLGSGSIGFDFNPTVDRIRVVGANKKNYRLHPVTGAIAATDADLNFATGDPNSAATPAIGACAYTNSYIGSEATTLYDYDESLNILATQNPPNNGTLNTVGSSGIVQNPLSKSAGMDIYFNPVAGTNIAYLNANVGTSQNDNLYTVNLATGAVTSVGMIGSGLAVKDIAVVIDRTLPAVTGQMVYALTKTNSNFISFDSDHPEIIRSISAISGLTTGQQIVGMDFRPADRSLYALGYNASTRMAQLYRLDVATGAATAVNATAVALDLDSASMVGFDFNPLVDRIRVVNSKGRNYRLNPNDGSVAATDSMLHYAPADPNAGISPRVGTVAYTNSYPGTTATTVYGIDDSLRVFLNITPPNNGVLNTNLTAVLPLNAADRTTDMDFFYDSTAMTNKGFLSANTATVNDTLYSIATNGIATRIGSIGYGIPITDIAVQLSFTNKLSVGNVHTAGEQFIVYPNPAGDRFSVVLPVAPRTATTVMLSDISGRIVQQWNFDGQDDILHIPAQDIAPGIYLLQVSNKQYNYNATRLVKQ